MKVIMAYFELGLLYRHLSALGEGNDRETETGPVLISYFYINFQQFSTGNLRIT